MNRAQTIQALYWDRGRPARYEREARAWRRKLMSCEVLALSGARGRRDARGPREEVELSLNT
jgi:hypothetical protein